MGSHCNKHQTEAEKIGHKNSWAAWLAIFSILTPQISAAGESATSPASSDKTLLPDLLDQPARQDRVAIRPGPGGVAFEGNFERQKVTVTPEYSKQTGMSLSVALASMLGDQAAFGVLLTAGADKKELLLNAGFKPGINQRFIFTFGQLKQNLDYDFLSGTEKTGMTQNSGGFSYQFQLGSEFLKSLELNGYAARTASHDLSDKTFAIDSATLFELWNDPRRIAGGKLAGLQGRLGFSPLAGSLVKASLGQEQLTYDQFTGKDRVNRLTSGVEWQQQIGKGYQIKAAADTFASQNRYTLAFERSLAGPDGRHNLGIGLVALHGRDGLGDDRQFQLTYRYIFGAGSAAPAINPLAITTPASLEQPATWSDSSLLDQVAQRPGYIPSRIVARVDNTALPTRLIAEDKTALPAGTSINTTTGDLTVPLGIAVTGISGVTRNRGGFTNTGQFSLAGNNIVIRPSQITQPGSGITDIYVVTISNLGGGTTLATAHVSRGSVRIDSIVITPGDTTPPENTMPPAVTDTTDASTTLLASINENGTGYYLLLPAAAAAPSVTAVQAGTAFAMSANVTARLPITGLAAATDYRIYFVAKDLVDNVQTRVQSVDLTTAAAPGPTTSVFTVAP